MGLMQMPKYRLASVVLIIAIFLSISTTSCTFIEEEIGPPASDSPISPAVPDEPPDGLAPGAPIAAPYDEEGYVAPGL